MSSWRWLIAGILLVFSAGCDRLPPIIQEQIPEIELPSLFSTSTPIPSPTPVGDTLTYTIDQRRFNRTIQPGDYVPGTQLQFVARQDDLFRVRIDGLDTTKQTGDSFTWRGIVAPHVHGNFNLILSPTFGRNILQTNGSVSLTVFNPTPGEGEPPLSADPPYIYPDIDINYIVPQGRNVPGTSLVYLGFVGEEVEFGGITGFPRFRVGDSLRWEGLLRSNVYIVHNLRVDRVTAQGVVLRGTAEMRVYPQLP